jgi:hypothetical protein
LSLKINEIELMTNNQNVEIGEKLRSLSDDHYSHIDNAIDSGFGIESWFRAYIQSDAFARLPPEIKLEAFNTYEGIKKYLKSIFDTIDAYD